MEELLSLCLEEFVDENIFLEDVLLIVKKIKFLFLNNKMKYKIDYLKSLK